MTNNTPFQLMLVLMLVVLSGCSPEQHTFTNGSIYTADKSNPWVEAVIVEGDLIVYAGSREGMAEVVNSNAIHHDLKGKLLLPGFIDAHVHTSVAAILSAYDSLDVAETHEEVIKKLKTYASKNQEEWLFVSGLHIGMYGEDVNLTKEELDAIEPNKPTIVLTSDLHSMWLNSKALDLYGFTRESPDIVGGVIHRDQNRSPTGMISDKAASNLMPHLPIPKLKILKGFSNIFNQMSQLGYTSFMEAYVNIPDFGQVAWGFDLLGMLNLRTTIAIYYDQDMSIANFLEYLESFKKYETDLIKVDTVKFMVDGATLPEMYNDVPLKNKVVHPNGLIEADKLEQAVTAISQAGYSVHMHVVGNKATKVALDAVESARIAVPNAKGTFSLTHLFATRSEDVKRFKQLNVIANYQPNFFNPNWSFLALWKDTMRGEILERSFLVKDLFDSGAIISASTDYPVQLDNNPLHAIEVGITRDDALAPTGIPFNEGQSLGVREWVDAYTVNAAKQLGLDAITGSIEVGKKSDLIILNNDIFMISTAKISDARVIMTMFNGDIIYHE